MKERRNYLSRVLFLAVIFLDQWTKYLARTELDIGESVEILPGLFNLTLVYNPGAAFGLFSTLDDTWRKAALITTSILALATVAYFLANEAKNDMPSRLALSSIVAGAVGNIVDRFRFDSVVDFLDFYFKGYHWPAFNVADSAISIGVCFLVIRWTVWKRN